jgi:hypothetical protein
VTVLLALLAGAAIFTISRGFGGDPSTANGDPPLHRDRGGPTHSASTGPTERLTHFRFFSPHSFWNTPVPPRARVDPRSRELSGTLADEAFREVEEKTGPFITTNRFGVPVFRVPGDEPTTRVKLVTPTTTGALQSAWNAVPLPSGAEPATGNDGQLVVWQPATDRLWEFWRLKHGPRGWRAYWGGAMMHVSEGPGVYGTSVWPGARPWWGASASSLSIAGGLITFEDWNHGEINHALAISLPRTRAGVYSLPARRTDGTWSSLDALPEGAHLQLDPGLDLAKVPMSPATRMIAKAAQRYGIFVRDTAKDITFYGQDPEPKEYEPYRGKDGYYGGRTPIELLAEFPWHHLRVLKMSLRRDRRGE